MVDDADGAHLTCIRRCDFLYAKLGRGAIYLHAFLK